MKQKGTPLHDATVIGDTVGDPFKDTSSVALNPVIKFTTLFGLLAVELAVTLTHDQDRRSNILALAFFAVSFFFVTVRSTACEFEPGNKINFLTVPTEGPKSFVDFALQLFHYALY